MTTTPETTKVAVAGPFSQGFAIHVHDAKCEDLTRRKIYRDARGEQRVHEIDANGWKDIVTFVYPESDFNYSWDNEEERSQYEGDIQVFPCVHLPADDMPAPKPKSGRGFSTVAKDGEMECRLCKQAKSVTKFPTKSVKVDGEVVRDDRCRDCGIYVREGNKIGRPKNVPPPPGYGRPIQADVTPAHTDEPAPQASPVDADSVTAGAAA